jgi:hypothetical protein
VSPAAPPGVVVTLGQGARPAEPPAPPPPVLPTTGSHIFVLLGEPPTVIGSWDVTDDPDETLAAHLTHDPTLAALWRACLERGELPPEPERPARDPSPYEGDHVLPDDEEDN